MTRLLPGDRAVVEDDTEVAPVVELPDHGDALPLLDALHGPLGLPGALHGEHLELCSHR